MSKNYFYGHGKLLLTGEYLVLDGAKALALPTKLGQQMHVELRPSSNPKLYWKSYDDQKKVWFDVVFELWHFDILSFDESLVDLEKVEILQSILRQARKQNIHFLREQVDFHVSTKLEFPIEWGLGTSSTLIYNIAQWAYVSPFELLEKTFGGSGYDIACAQSMGPIVYQNLKRGPQWETANFYPVFKDQIYFVYLNQKQNSRHEIQRYRDLSIDAKTNVIEKINKITEACLDVVDIKDFENLMLEHERIVAGCLDRRPVQEELFGDFDGVVKSLGAWGGDFVIVVSSLPEEAIKKYFIQRGFDKILRYDDLILQTFPRYNDSEIKLKRELSHGLNAL